MKNTKVENTTVVENKGVVGTPVATIDGKVIQLADFTNEKGKMTKKEKFTLLIERIELIDDEKMPEKYEAIDFLQNELDLIEKKTSKRKENKKPSKAYEENKAIALQVVEFYTTLAEKGKLYLYSDVIEKVGLPSNTTPQKMTNVFKIAVELLPDLEKGQDKERKTGFKLN